MSLNPYESLFPKASWKGGIVMDQLPAARKDDRNADCHDTVFGCERLRTNVGYGISKLIAETGSVMAFGFLQWEMAFSNAFRPHFRVAPGAHAGILFDPIPHWRVMLSSQFTKGVWGDGRITDQSSVQIRWRLKQNVDLRAEYHEYRVDREANFGMSLFL